MSRIAILLLVAFISFNTSWAQPNPLITDLAIHTGDWQLIEHYEPMGSGQKHNLNNKGSLVFDDESMILSLTPDGRGGGMLLSQHNYKLTSKDRNKSKGKIELSDRAYYINGEKFSSSDIRKTYEFEYKERHKKDRNVDWDYLFLENTNTVSSEFFIFKRARKKK